MAPDLEFIYIGDPMCSWCWGFAPVLERLDAAYDIPVRTVVGGLRPGADGQPLDDRLRAVLFEHWDHVEEASGQPFDRAALDRRPDGWVYDTEPGCRAVVAMRELAPDATLRWFARVQQAFYAEGVDVTDLEVFPTLLDGFAVDPDRFREALVDGANRKRTWQDFAQSRNWGVAGFPALLLRDGETLAQVTRGWIGWDALAPALDGWLDERFGTEVASSLACVVGGDAC